MSKSNLTQYLGEVRVCVSPMVYIKRKYIPTHETAPFFLYKPIKLATYSYCESMVISSIIESEAAISMVR